MLYQLSYLGTVPRERETGLQETGAYRRYAGACPAPRKRKIHLFYGLFFVVQPGLGIARRFVGLKPVITVQPAPEIKVGTAF